nr:hypothetical protein [Tanacetum cinerariifolium]
MVKSSSSLENKACCSKSYRKNTEDLNTKITKLSEALSNSKTMLYHYKLGLSQVEARLVELKNQKIKFCEKIRGLEFNVESKNNRIERLTNELEQIKKEKKGLDSKLTGFESAAKDLDTLLESQRSDKNKEGLGYNDTITDYIRPSPSIESNSSDLQRNNSFVSGLGESSGSIMSKPIIKFVKTGDSSKIIKTTKGETARKPPVRYAEMYRNTIKSPKVRGNQRNWNNLMNQRLGSNFEFKNIACYECGSFDHLIKDCCVHRKQEKGKTWPKKNFPHKNVTPRADLFKTASVSATRRVNTAAPRPNVNSARPKTTQDLVIILIPRVKRLERELKARTPPTKIHKVDVRGRSRSVMAWVPKKINNNLFTQGSRSNLSGTTRGSLKVDGLPMMPQDSYAYVEATFQALPSPDYFMPPEDDVLPAEEQPLPVAVSPTTNSPGYIPKSNPEGDPKEDLKEDPADYLTDREDDEEEEESSGDDADDEEEDEHEDEEEEHPSPANSVPPPVHRVTARMSVRAQTPISLPLETNVARLLTIPTLPPSPLSLLSSPLPSILSPLPQILSPPLLIPSPLLPASPTYPLGDRAVMIRLRAESPSTSYPPPPIVLPYTMASMAMLRAATPSIYILTPRSKTPPSGTLSLLPILVPASSLPLLLPSTDCRADVRKVTLPSWKRLCITLGPRFEVSESSSAPTTRPTRGFRTDYGFVVTLDDEIRRDPKREVGLSQRMTDFVMTVRHDTDEIYGRMDDAQDDKLLMIDQLNMLHKDRCAHARKARLMESAARLSREAWVQSMDASDTACAKKKMALKRTTKLTPATKTITTTTPNDDTTAEETLILDVHDLESGSESKSEPEVVVKNALKAKSGQRKRNDKEEEEYEIYAKKLRRGRRFRNTMIR